MKTSSAGNIRNVVITRNAYKWQYGGAEQFAYNLASVFRDEGVEAVVMTRVPELLKHCKQDRIKTFKNIWLKNETHRRWMPVYYALFPILIGQYAWVLKRHKADLLICTSRDDQIFGTMAAKLVGVPVVWFDHADMKHIVATPFRFLSKSYYWSMRNADRVIMTSKAEHEKITANLDVSKQSNFVMINNGAMKRAGVAMERPAGKKIVAYAGRLDRDKGLFDLVEAAKSIVQRVPEAEFWMGGKGPDEDELRTRIHDAGLDAHFKLLGHLDNVADLLLAADVFVYPTHHDAAPLAPVEALLAGVPVVASRIGGIPEMIPETAGVLVPAHDPAALAREIADLLSDAAKRARFQAGAKAAGHDMEFATVLRNKYLPLFEEIMKERHENRR